MSRTPSMLLAERIETLFNQRAAIEPEAYGPEYYSAFEELKAGLNAGVIRAADPSAAAPSGWRVNPWVKMGILLGFRLGRIENMSADHGRFPFFDKHTY